MDQTLPQTPATPPAVPGLTLGRLLGFGAHGEVWLGTEDVTGDVVAVKVGRAANPAVPAEHDVGAVPEVALLARIDHPHVLPLRQAVPMTGGRTALVLEYAPGGSLGALVASRGVLDPAEVTTLLVPLAQALAHLHGRGLAHGDLSPGNVLFAADGRPLLADLGVAHVLGTAGRGPFGTPGFTDPAAGISGDGPRRRTEPDGFADPSIVRGVDPRASDVWGLGAVGWFALTGGPPPPGRPVPPPSALHVPALTGLLADCLSPDPECRPSPAELADRAWRAVRPAPVRLLPAGDVVGSLRADASALTTRRVQQPPPASVAPAEPARRRWRRAARHRPADARVSSALRPTPPSRPAAAPSHPAAAPGGSTVGLVGGPFAASPGVAGGASRAAASPARRQGASPVLAAAPPVRRAGLSTPAVAPRALGGSDGPRGRAVRWAGVTVACALAVGAGVAVGSATWSSRHPGAPPASSPRPTPTPADAGPGSPGAGGSTAAPGAAGAAADEARGGAVDATFGAVLAGIARARAEAFSTASTGPLAAADEPGSPAMAADAAVIRRLADRGWRLDGVDYAVSDVRLVRRDAGTAAVTATVRTSWHRQVTRTGTLVAEIPADRPRRVTLTLVAAGGGAWRVRSVS